MPPELVRAPSQGSIVSQTTQQMGSHSRPGTADPMRARSETLSRAARRPRSRGSTASIHSSTTQQTQDQHLDGFPQFMPSQVGGGQHVFGNNPEDMLMRFGHQLSHQSNGASLDPTVRDSHAMASRPDEFPAHAMHAHNLSHHGLPDIPHSALSAVAVPQYQAMYDSGIENHLADHTMDDQEASEAGGKKKRGSSSTLANDNELRKLLRQYEGYTLKQMAAEVMKHEGAGGKAEKVKQVFAMIWLRENCRKSNGSVRRDRVYCCYAEKCGTERVSVLNPASFGKLVRIIFPNVQTRRLGVRGESKYHYVDLSVIEEKQQRPVPLNPQVALNPHQVPAGVPERPASGMRSRSISIAQPTADTAVFPSPTTSFAPRFPANPPTTGCCNCQAQSPSGPDAAITTQNVSQQAGKMIHQMLQFPTDEVPSIDNESLVLPDIRGYLPLNTDPKVAEALAALYRSHCISVIDSFRFCKERNLLKYFSAFHGTLTVPVQKLLTHPNLAPWIKECDWLMYQKMIAFVAPLTTQVVPKLVLDAFSSISQRLCGHIAETFKAQPSHVSIARLIPAHIFCNLLKHMLDVNQAANAAAAWLCHPDNRNQMWFDFKSLVDPKDMILKANIPTCAEQPTEQILKHDVRALLTPLDDTDASTGLPIFSKPDGPEAIEAHQFPVETATGEEYNFPDKWISFILNLPLAFSDHRTQCVIKKIDALWDSILHRLTLGGAASFSAWWMTKVFFHEMMVWQAEKGGFMRNTPGSLQSMTFGSEQASMGSFQLKQNVIPEPPTFETARGAHSKTNTTASPDLRGTRDQTIDAETDTKHVPNAKELALADTGFQVPNNDDSAIDLEDDPLLMAVGKYGDMMVSDPADAEGDVIVI